MTGPPFSPPTPYQAKPLTPHVPVPLEQGAPDHPLAGIPGGQGPFAPAQTPPPGVAFSPSFAPSAGTPMLATPGMQPVDLSQFLTPPTPQTITAETQGETPDVVSMLQDEIKQRELADQDKRTKAMKAIYGSNFPLVMDATPSDSDWTRWCDDRWTIHRPGMQHNIWMAERNRQFRAGYQWQSRINSMGAWRETPTPRDSVKIVDNRIRPALAWAMQVVAEQRPGWQFKPTNTDADRERKAEAQQRAVEYQYDAQKKRLIDKEAIYWAQTDGVAFQMTYYDPDLGPWEAWEPDKPGQATPMGEPMTRVFRIEQTVVSSEATSTIPPMYQIVRDIIPMQYAVSLYGPDVADAPDQALLAQQTSQFSTTNQYAYAPLYQNQMTVSRYFIFCDRKDWLPEGLTAVVVGRKLVYGPKPLLIGRIPMVRITDGSEDPAYFPVPKMNQIIGPQMRINMLWSKWYQSIRQNAGGRYATKSNAVSAETLIGGETTMLEVRTSGDIREAILPVNGFSVGADIKEALDREIQTIEDLTGYTKEARGQFESDQSGRAILAQRETLERSFAPLVGALSEGNTEWAKQTVGWMKFGYQLPRKIAILGKNRSDLAMELTADMLDGIVDITVDPASMIPKPRALKQWEVDQAFDRKIIGVDEWRERSEFGDTNDFQTPNDIQYAKAKRVSEQLKLRQPVEAILWQDDEAIHQNVLERDLILAGGTDPDVLKAAQQRWQQLAQQHGTKTGPPAPTPGSPEADYAAFINTALADLKTAADQMLARAAEAQILTSIAPPVTPQTTPGVNVSTPPHFTPPIKGRTPGAGEVGKPMDPRTAPLLSSNPSVAAAPSPVPNVGRQPSGLA